LSLPSPLRTMVVFGAQVRAAMTGLRGDGGFFEAGMVAFCFADAAMGSSSGARTSRYGSVRSLPTSRPARGYLAERISPVIFSDGSASAPSTWAAASRIFKSPPPRTVEMIASTRSSVSSLPNRRTDALRAA